MVGKLKHLGDITKLSGYDMPVVDVITGGSPCQDLSIAGNRAGLDGERSGLFMEQIRIVKEMRESDRATGRTGFLVRPRFMVWENVPGAFSSNGGRDFQAVLTEIIRIAEPEAPDVPLPVRGGWTKSGCLYSDVGHWSVAWRVHDGQFWGPTQWIDDRVWIRGTPQRRKRIALVADFGGFAAPEILFERKGSRWYSSESREKRQGASDGTEDSPGEPSTRVYGISAYNSCAMKSSNPHSGIYETNTTRTLDLNGGTPACNQGVAVVSIPSGVMEESKILVLNDQGGV